ncbi:hypothetical protein CLV82_0972 [Zeaxanthinibacter enoshimensis]|uniref:Uncharacterized protein n=1 Tax=Zeaxanthinibacter enoshimensis TaxID=392009 RepID=A0A4R6TNL1_9FLAO|nr:hypothetical protein CLV82_0972 [Zeaxanthinibacter enoshimensis]
MDLEILPTAYRPLPTGSWPQIYLPARAGRTGLWQASNLELPGDAVTPSCRDTGMQGCGDANSDAVIQPARLNVVPARTAYMQAGGRVIR